MHTRLAPLIVATLLSACGTSPMVTPLAMHAPGLAQSESSIFVSVDQRTNEPVLSTLLAVDDRPVECHFNAGCPVWTRVSAQGHEFSILYRANFYGLPGVTTSGHEEAVLKVKVDEMKPRHVYVARYFREHSTNNVSVRVEDLGENPKFALRVPLFGTSNPSYFPAEF